MTPFDIDKAKAGHPVCTREGLPVKLICFDTKGTNFPLVGLISENVDDSIKESIATFTKEGKYNACNNAAYDLFMAPIKKHGYINIYKYFDSPNGVAGEFYETKEEAEESKVKHGYICTIKIEWEE